MAVDRLPDGSFIGWCGLTSWNPAFRTASRGYVFDAAARGNGYATETAHAVPGADLHRARYEHLRGHGLRPTAWTWFADAGVQMHVLRRIAGTVR